MELTKPIVTSRPQASSEAVMPERVPGNDAPTRAVAPGSQGDSLTLDGTAVPAAAPVSDEAVGQRRNAQLNAQRLRELAEVLNRELEFRVADSGRAIIDVVDTKTGEVIRTIPPDDQQRLIDALGEGDVSLLLDGAA